MTSAALAIAAGRPTEIALIAAVFAASLAGFLRFNFPPATIFLGDAGSMFIGLMVGALSIQGSLKGPGTVLLAAPLAVLTIPILDSVAAIVRRTLSGRSIYATDRRHLHHRLLDRLGSGRKVLAWIGIFCATTSAAALLSVLLHNDLLAVIACLGVVMILVTTGLFGRAELMLLGMRLRRVGRGLMPSGLYQPTRAHRACIRFQGSQTWELLWETFTESVDKLDLTEVSLDINFPAAKEGCHALWERGRRIRRDERWSLKLPLMVDDQPVGWLKVVGECTNHSTCQSIQQLLDMIEPFEKEALAVAGDYTPVVERLSRSTVVEEVSRE